VVKKQTLIMSDSNSAENLLLYTIASSESDIHLCLLINKIFKISLSLSEDFEVVSKNFSNKFRKYEFENEEDGEKFILLSNRNNSGQVLMPEFKKIDFILLIISETPAANYEKRIQLLKDDNAIAAIFKIDPTSVKSFGKLKI
jgi:hypothetical protein